MLLEKSPSKFITSIYRKPTFTGQYLRWNSFSSQKRKTNVILTLTHRAMAICSPEKLPSELDKIKFILQTNGYLEHVVKSCMAKKMKQFEALPEFGPEICPIYLSLPWLFFHIYPPLTRKRRWRSYFGRFVLTRLGVDHFPNFPVDV